MIKAFIHTIGVGTLFALQFPNSHTLLSEMSKIIKNYYHVVKSYLFRYEYLRTITGRLGTIGGITQTIGLTPLIHAGQSTEGVCGNTLLISVKMRGKKWYTIISTVGNLLS